MLKRLLIILIVVLTVSGAGIIANAAAPPEAPRNLQARAAANAAKVNLSWSASATTGVRYRLYRSTASGQTGSIRQDDIDGLLFIDTTAAYNTVYYYRVSALLDAVESVLSAPAWARPALIPTNVQASDVKTGRQIKITWERPTLELSLKYNVFRAAVSSEPGGAVGSNIEGTEFLDTAVSDGVAYYYRVKAVGLDGTQFDLSALASAIASDAVAPERPTVSAAGSADGRVGVSWSAPRNEPIASYYLYRSTSPSGLGPQIFNGNAVSYTDTGQVPGAILYYAVTARDAAGNVSEPSAPAKAVIPGSTAPALRTQIIVSNLNADGTPRPGEINLHWQMPSSSGIAYARIYRSLIAGEPGGMMADKVYGSSFLDKLALGGRRYYYSVRLVDQNGTEYQGSAQVSGTSFTEAARSEGVGEEPRAPAKDDKSAGKKAKDKKAVAAGKTGVNTESGKSVSPAEKPGAAKSIYVYNKPRLDDLKKEGELALKLREELRQALKGRMPPPRLWPQLVKQYVYGGYAAWEIAEDLKFGPGLVHPILSAEKWRKMWGYGKHKK